MVHSRRKRSPDRGRTAAPVVPQQSRLVGKGEAYMVANGHCWRRLRTPSARCSLAPASLTRHVAALSNLLGARARGFLAQCWGGDRNTESSHAMVWCIFFAFLGNKYPARNLGGGMPLCCLLRIPATCPFRSSEKLIINIQDIFKQDLRIFLTFEIFLVRRQDA